MADWITPEEVAAYLDDDLLAEDDNLLLATATVKAAVERRRSDLKVGDPPAFTPGPDVHGGAVMWAAIVWQARNTTGEGVAGYDDSMMFDVLGARRAEVLRLIGWRRPVIS